MRRWNGWGDDTVDFEVPQAVSEYLAKLGEFVLETLEQMMPAWC